MNDLPLKIEHLTFHYKRRDEPSLVDISLELKKGEILLVAGASGCGKTTLMRCINGLIPRTYQGEKKGSIELFGEAVEKLSMAELSQQVGTLLQDPERQIVGSFVFGEVAFGLENLGLPREEIIRRVDETLNYLGILHLRDRETFHLSGGEKQKIALAGVLAMQPKVLLLDEPLASLDPASAQEALQIFRRLADDGLSIMLVEHRVEDVLSIHPESVIYLDEGRVMYAGCVEGLMQVVDYKRIKLPAPVVVARARGKEVAVCEPALPPHSDTALVSFEDVGFRYAPDKPEVIKGVSFKVHPGDVIAILGHNGAGKTTLVKHALGLLKPTSGRVLLEGRDTRQSSVAQNAHSIGYVFQSPSQMLFAQTVGEELSFGPRNLKHPVDQIKQDVDWAIHTVHLENEMAMPPLALSFGQQKRISIAAILAMRSRILMMDEPTAGQDYWNYLAFMDGIVQMPGFDAILFITHDVDLAVTYATRVLLVSGGTIVADGPTHDVLADEDRLRRCRVLPSSLLKMNLEMWPQTGRFMRAEALANLT
ncbi:MAG TPA: energy-coupling factor transporter ATPase [Anaerolineaceae bacterium]|nr:energy-coupling factor transporter ATPase [Anaerolineaceae bacterium]HPN52715.1 energy-coupling factor transporter ATPase [Anaerolineaceae bacterium]